MKIFFSRLGAFGDGICVLPVLRYLARDLGHEVIVDTEERGKEIFANNPYAAGFTYRNRKNPEDEDVVKYWDRQFKASGADVFINMAESLERSLALNVWQPQYNYPKEERRELCDHNFYEYAFLHAKQKWPDMPVPTKYDSSFFRPELFFTEEEEKWAEEFFAGIRDGHKKVMAMVWNGSRRNKIWPWMGEVARDFLDRKGKNWVVVGLGDMSAEIVGMLHPEIIDYTSKLTFRQSCLVVKYADLFLSPDTGLMHAAGCFDTPKVGVFGHHTINQLTKHFLNDFSVQADENLCPCAPCNYLIGENPDQCPHTHVSNERTEGDLPWCMARGIRKEIVLQKLLEASRVKLQRSMPEVAVA